MEEGARDGKEKKQTFHLAPEQSVDLHVEGLIGVRWAPNQRNMAGNVSEPQENRDCRNRDKKQMTVTNYTS